MFMKEHVSFINHLDHSGFEKSFFKKWDTGCDKLGCRKKKSYAWRKENARHKTQIVTTETQQNPPDTPLQNHFANPVIRQD